MCPKSICYHFSIKYGKNYPNLNQITVKTFMKKCQCLVTHWHHHCPHNWHPHYSHNRKILHSTRMDVAGCMSTLIVMVACSPSSYCFL